MSRVHLGRRLILEARVELPDGAGGLTRGWQALGTLWAEVSPGTGREAGATETVVSATAYRITVRAAPEGSPARPLPGQRLRDASRIFAIQAVAERDRRAQYLTCFATEEVRT